MKNNIGIVDRFIRLLIAVLIGVLFFIDIIGGTWGTVLLVFAFILFATSVVGFCPVYAMLGADTASRHRRVSKSESPHQEASQ